MDSIYELLDAKFAFGLASTISQHLQQMSHPTLWREIRRIVFTYAVLVVARLVEVRKKAQPNNLIGALSIIGAGDCSILPTERTVQEVDVTSVMSRASKLKEGICSHEYYKPVLTFRDKYLAHLDYSPIENAKPPELRDTEISAFMEYVCENVLSFYAHLTGSQFLLEPPLSKVFEQELGHLLVGHAFRVELRKNRRALNENHALTIEQQWSPGRLIAELASRITNERAAQIKDHP